MRKGLTGSTAAVVSLGAIVAAELLTVADPRVGLPVHAAIVLVLLRAGALTRHEPTRRLLLGLTLPSLMRMISLSLPLDGIPILYAHAILSVPAFGAIIAAARTIGHSRQDLGLTFRLRFLAVAIIMVPIGLTLGFVEYLILQPEPVTETLSPTEIWLAALILFLSTGFLEELLFRGLLQSAAVRLLGPVGGVLYVTTIFTSLHLGYQSTAQLAMAVVLGVFFGIIALRTGSVLGPTLGHASINVSLLLITPLVMGDVLDTGARPIPLMQAPTGERAVAPQLAAQSIPSPVQPRVTTISTPRTAPSPAVAQSLARPAEVVHQVPVVPDQAPRSAAPSAPVARTVLDVRFRGALAGWPNDSQSTAWFVDDAYRLFAREPSRFVAIGAPIAGPLRDVVVTASFHKVGGPPGGGYGLIVRDEGPGPRDGLDQGGRYYVLEVGDRGEIGVWRRERDHWVDLIPWTRSEAVRPDRATNELTARAIGRQLTLLVNGDEVARCEDAALAEGGVGIFVGGDYNEVAVDRVVVEALNWP